MSTPDHYYPEYQWDPADDGDPEWLPPDDRWIDDYDVLADLHEPDRSDAYGRFDWDQWIDDYEAQFEDARDPFLQPDEPDDGR